MDRLLNHFVDLGIEPADAVNLLVSLGDYGWGMRCPSHAGRIGERGGWVLFKEDDQFIWIDDYLSDEKNEGSANLYVDGLGEELDDFKI
jgi:hypothetical protein